MFLFTTQRVPEAPSSTPATHGPVPAAALQHVPKLEDAAKRTGTSFDYLLRTAERESGFDARAKAPTSSATGLFQFLDQTWLGVMKSDGGKHGLSAEADAIQSDGGRLTVPDPAMRQRILALREDPAVSATMAGVFTAKNRESLTQALGRAPSQGELYVAHFLGAGGAGELISLAERTPEARASSAFPDAAAANRSIFYDKAGNARSARDVYDALVASFGKTPPPALPAPPGADPRLLEGFQAKMDPARPMLGLFRTDQPINGPISKDRARQWLALDPPTTPAVRVAFFPRDATAPVASDPVATVAAAPPAPIFIANGGRADVPMPPARPSDLGQAQRARHDGAAKPPRVLASPPLDLKQFLASNVAPR